MKSLISLLMIKLIRSTDAIPNIHNVLINERSPWPSQSHSFRGMGTSEEDIPASQDLSDDPDFVIARNLKCVKDHVTRFLTKCLEPGCDDELAKIRSAVEELIVGDILSYINSDLRNHVRAAGVNAGPWGHALRAELKEVVAQRPPLFPGKLTISHMNIKDMPIPAIWFMSEYSIPRVTVVHFKRCTGVRLEAFNEYDKDIPNLKELEASQCNIKELLFLQRLTHLNRYLLDGNDISGFDVKPYMGAEIKGPDMMVSLLGNAFADEKSKKSAEAFIKAAYEGRLTVYT